MPDVRVLFHAINGVGLGHLARTVALALAARDQGDDVLVLTSAGDTSLLVNHGLDHVRLPPRLREPHADPLRGLTALDEDLERAAARAVVDTFAPDVLVGDTHPPPWLIRHARERGIRCVLVLRELRPDVLAALVHGDLITSFDRVLVPHDASEFDASSLPWFLPAALLGPVLRPLDPRPLASHGRPLVVALAGGGGQPVDSRRYARAVADAHALLRLDFPGLETVLIAGPYGRPPARRPDGLRVLGAVADVASWIAAADLVISQAGYNAVAELTALRAPVVLIPGHRRSEDQRARARRLVRRGAAVIAPAEASALADVITPLLADPARREAMRAAHAPLPPRNADAARWLLGRRPPSAPLHVALVAHGYPPRPGGMEVVARQLARSLSARGLRVTVYTTPRIGLPADDGVTVRAIYDDLGPPASVDLWGDLAPTLAALGRDAPDVLHLTSASLAPWVPTLRRAFDGAITVHAHGNDVIAPWTRHGLSPDALSLATARGLSAADAVVAVSHFTADLARRAGASDPLVITSGVDSEHFSPAPHVHELHVDSVHEFHMEAPPRVDAPPVGASPLLVTVSRLVPRKGHATVVRALPAVLRRHPSARYAFTGQGPLLDELTALADSLGVAHALDPRGVLDEDDVLALLRSASVFVLVPEDDEHDVEGYGLALLEAAACGIPVISSLSGGAPEATRPLGGSLIPPGDHDALAHAVMALLDDPPLAARLGASARAAAQAFPWSLTAHHLADLFTRLCATSRASVLDASPHGGSTGADVPTLGDPSDVCSLWPAMPDLSALPERSAYAAERWLACPADGASLRHLARSLVSIDDTARRARRERYRAVLAAGRTVHLRATGAGLRRLPDALDDCASLGHRPVVELSLHAALDPAFVRHALPRIDHLLLDHRLPSPSLDRLLIRLSRCPDALFASMASVRLSLNPDVPYEAVVTEVDTLEAFFQARGIPVAPPRVISANPFFSA